MSAVNTRNRVSLGGGKLFPDRHGNCEIHVENVFDEHVNDLVLVALEVLVDLLDVLLRLQLEFVLELLILFLKLGLRVRVPASACTPAPSYRGTR